MSKLGSSALLAAALALGLAAGPPGPGARSSGQPSQPPRGRGAASQDRGGAYATGRYRDLFVEAGHSRAEVAARIEAAFQQLFHGDSATQAVYYAAGANRNGPLAYLTDINNRDVRSEGMSYGMMIAVQLDKKAEFDALWNWSKTYMYHDDPAHPSYGFFSWSLQDRRHAEQRVARARRRGVLRHGAVLRVGALGRRARASTTTVPPPTGCSRT